MSHYTVYGALGSPYSMKIRAVMRYRRLPHVWRQMSSDDDGVLKMVKVPVVPIVQYPDGSWHNDSTPLILDLERRHSGRSIVPTDSGEAFLASLIEDMADEWGTKAMFYYRWTNPRDQIQLSEWIAYDRLAGSGRAAIGAEAFQFRDRQVGRMALVGCSPANGPVIEVTTHRILDAFEQHVTDQRYLFGSRPSLADFGWYGQLSQLAIDPTPHDLLRDRYRYTYRWLANIEDASGVEGVWREPSQPYSPAIASLVLLAGEVYLPFLRANARAIELGDQEFEVVLLGHPFRQATFKYQARCLQSLQKQYIELDASTRERLRPLMSESGCVDVLEGN